MLQEHFNRILDHFTEWRIGADNYHKSKVGGRPRKDKNDEPSNPIKAFPIVLSHKPITYECEWCDGICAKEKSFKRSIGSNIWTAKCQDCGETRNIPTCKINHNK